MNTRPTDSNNPEEVRAYVTQQMGAVKAADTSRWLTIEALADYPTARAQFGDPVSAFKAAADRLGIDYAPKLTQLECNMILHTVWATR